MKITASSEDYLEAVLVLSRRHDVRMVDIAEYLGFKKSSVSRAVKLLIQSGFLTKDRRNTIHLTEKGMKSAESILQKHRFFAELLEKAGVEEEEAERDACRMEHAISDASFRKLEEFLAE